MRLQLSFFLLLWTLSAGSQEISRSLFTAAAPTGTAGRQIIPEKYLGIAADEKELRGFFLGNTGTSASILIPDPEGTFRRFTLTDSKVMDPELARSYPEIRSYNAQCADDPRINGKVDYNLFGFHAMISTPAGEYFIDPYSVYSAREYVCYYKRDYKRAAVFSEPFDALPQPERIGDLQKKMAQGKQAFCTGDTLHNYRLVVACTHQYAMAATGSPNPTMPQALSKIVLTMNRVNSVYEKEAALRLVLAPSTTLVVFTSAANDPFTSNNNVVQLTIESQKVLDSIVGANNYDIGHTFCTGNGGLAWISCLCVTGHKGKGVSGSTSPSGDPFDIDYVSHEMGHQLGGTHTFNAITGSCNGNRFPASAVEPGSGITIMGYAGICGVNDLGSHSIPYLHALSYDEIVRNTREGTGSGCASREATGNQAPVVAPLIQKYTVPKGTPYVLKGSASDPDGDPLTYSWEETSRSPAAANWNSDVKPYWRSYTPSLTPVRYFPSETVLKTGNYTGTRGEYLTSKPQLLAFRFTARDNRLQGGGVCSDSTVVEISAAGPFSVTVPNDDSIVWPQKSYQEIKWIEGGTSGSPVWCSFVNIWLSLDNGNSYTMVAQTVANNGQATVKLPAVSSTVTTCRIRIECNDNIFFDLSDQPFTITTDTTVGLNDHALGGKLKVFPNPAGEFVEFTRENPGTNGPQLVRLYDVSGRILRQAQFPASATVSGRFELEQLAKGLYFIAVEADGRTEVCRVVRH